MSICLNKFLLAATLTVSSTAALASTSVSYLYGDGYVTGDEKRDIIRFDTLQSKGPLDLFVRVDIGSFNDESTINTRIITHLNVKDGWRVAGQLQNAHSINIKVVGAGYRHSEPDTLWLLDVGRSSSNVYGDGTHLFGYANKRLIGNFYFDGFVEFNVLDDGVNILLSQPSLMYRIGNLDLGMEQQIYRNKFGVKGLNESVSQFKVNLKF